MSAVRYFRSTVPVYAAVCAQLDAAYGYPNEQTLTKRALPLADTLHTDSEGWIYLGVLSEYCEFNLPSELLPQLIASGLVEEFTLAQWESKFPPPQVP
jgi:hypothetical protein